MSVAHPWLEQEPWPTQAMPKAMLEQRIERVLTMTNIGYLGTVKKDGSPIVSPLEFLMTALSFIFFRNQRVQRHMPLSVTHALLLR